MRMPELLSPAGDLECVRTALRFGADAVYLGGPQLQLRAARTGFSLDQLRQAAALVHARNRKLYVTVNAFAECGEIDRLPEYGSALLEAGADAAIVSDPGAIATLRRQVPALSVHVSTQANCTNHAAAEVYRSLGASRIVLARELSLAQIRVLRSRLSGDVELEAFVHGAMCMAYSGRCMLSAFLTGRSANRGACTQPCRWTYHLMEETRPGQYFPVEEAEGGMAILSAMDLCCIGFVEKLADAGIASMKIEGRMKSPYYVATVTNAYRKRLDALAAGTGSAAQLCLLRRELDAISHRPYSSGFYFGPPRYAEAEDGDTLQDCVFSGVVTHCGGGRIELELRNRIPEGTRVEVVSPDAIGLSFVAENLCDDSGARVAVADRPSERYAMDCPLPLAPGDLLRVRKEGA